MPAIDRRPPLTILHTNDFHDRLTAGRADSIAQLLGRTADPKLLVDAGDAGGSSNVTFRSGGEPIFDEMNRLGYAAMTVGNRDFHLSRSGFRAKLSRAGFPVLCANVRPSRTAPSSDPASELPLGESPCEEPNLHAYIVADRGDWKVLVVGLTVPMITPRMWERKLSAYVFDPPVATAARIIPELRRRFQPDLCIALTHIGSRMDHELAKAVPEIDLIIGGHSHDLLPHGEQVDEVLVVQAGSHGRYIGVVTVCGPNRAPEVPRISARIEAL